MTELAEVLNAEHNLTATPANLSRYLTGSKNLYRYGKAAQKVARRAIRVAAPPDAEDAP